MTRFKVLMLLPPAVVLLLLVSAFMVWGQTNAPIQVARPGISLPFDTGQAILFLTLVVKAIIDYFDKRQARKWFEDDRKHTDEQRAVERREREAVARNVEETARTMAINNKEIKEGLAENTLLTTAVGHKAEAAYKEANNVNLKIAAVGNVRQVPPGEDRRSPGQDGGGKHG